MGQPVIETQSLTRKFGGLTAVSGLNLLVPSAGVYGFLGPNGAGKTTTIRLLLGLIRPHAGEVRLFGRGLAGGCIDLLRRVGALVETPSLYRHLTGRENLEVTRRMLGVERSRVDEALATVGMREASGRRVGGYSLGMRQRLGLGAALLGRPELLVLDEPFNGLDPAGITEMRGLIRGLPEKNGTTVFISSHLLNEVEQTVDFIGIIQEGRLRFQGPLSRLQAQRRTRLELGVDRPDAALRLLAKKGWKADSEPGGFLLVELKNGKDAAARINALLTGEGLGIHHLRIRQPSLEDIFLSLTGDRERRPQ